VEGLIAFRNAYSGKLWIEVMLVKNINDNELALREMAALLKEIRPDEVHLLQPERPPAEPWVEPTDEEGLLRAHAILGDLARVIAPAGGSFDLGGSESLVEAVVGIITRHPMREDELVATLNHWTPGEAALVIEALEKSGKGQVVERNGVRFWSASQSHYPKSENSN
jgi:wyosine [tRNA(Phe)-imidazoG37] synthetase (radical SAM superfamily)